MVNSDAEKRDEGDCGELEVVEVVLRGRGLDAQEWSMEELMRRKMSARWQMSVMESALATVGLSVHLVRTVLVES